MKTKRELLQKLQKSDRKHAWLYLFCNFISLLLITAYSAMMLSPTVLLVLPEGGDSRKQMTAIFVLALFGCVVFTIYASCLFFRKKSKQLGTLMALGASRRWLAPGLYKEVLLLSSTSSLLGILAGLPFVWLIWNGFRLLIVDSKEMELVLDFRFLYLSALFFVIVIACSCINAYRYLKRTNIMDVVHEEHKNEPVRQLGLWCGPVGIVLLFTGAVLGYLAPYIHSALFASYYPPAWLNLLYAPVFAGLYLIMLHTVVHGWRSHRKHPYKNLISRSMMKFQGKQTVNNLLVGTVLIAGAAFALFYLPTMASSQFATLANRPYDYLYVSPLTQNIPGQSEVAALASGYGLAPCDWHEYKYLVLGMDNTVEVEDEGNTYHLEHRELAGEGRFLPESAFCALTKETLSVEPGTYYAITNKDETGLYWLNCNAAMLTNMTTRETLPVTFAGYAHFDLLSGATGYYVLNDADYAKIAEGLTPEWQERVAAFNMTGEDNYAFASAFFYMLIGSYDPEYAIPSYYDRVDKIYANETGQVYWGDTDSMTRLSFDAPDSTEFRSYWLYMPRVTWLDKNDFLRTYAVFLMMFLFISIICILAALVICYTRCMTIALNNRYVFDDLKRLGASPEFLLAEVKSQSKNVFAVPCFVGMLAMYLFFALILYANDCKMTASELLSLGISLGILALLGLIIYLTYTATVKRMAKTLDIPR